MYHHIPGEVTIAVAEGILIVDDIVSGRRHVVSGEDKDKILETDVNVGDGVSVDDILTYVRYDYEKANRPE